jgi:hypothetical protein
MKNITIATIIFSSLFIIACASKSGDKVDCPECNNTTEILVGTKCVPIEKVEECGPDGHAHGDICHCFSDQEVTIIGERSFCLQKECHEHSDEHEHDDCDEEEHEHEHHDDEHEHDEEEHDH